MQKTLGVLCCLIFSNTLWAANPCEPIFQACQRAGYYIGGQKVGKGMISDCIQPVVNLKKYLPDTSFNEVTLAQCRVQVQSILK